MHLTPFPPHHTPTPPLIPPPPLPNSSQVDQSCPQTQTSTPCVAFSPDVKDSQSCSEVRVWRQLLSVASFMAWSWEAGMGLRMQCLSLAIKGEKNPTFLLPITRTLLPIEQAHVISIYSESPPLCIGSFHFNLSCSHCLIKKTVSGVTGKIKKLVCLWYVLECVWLSPLSPW